MTDARFEDGREAPLNLGAMDADDLSVISSLVQDAVFPSSEMRWDAKNARFAILLNRFRWEEGPARATRPERVQSVLSFQTVRGVASNGIDRSDKDLVLSVLSVSFEPGEDPSGYITITLAGSPTSSIPGRRVMSTSSMTRQAVAPRLRTTSPAQRMVTTMLAACRP